MSKNNNRYEDYKIECRFSVLDLEKVVCEYMKNGWEPSGSAFRRISDSPLSHTCQTLKKRKQKEEQ